MNSLALTTSLALVLFASGCARSAADDADSASAKETTAAPPAKPPIDAGLNLKPNGHSLHCVDTTGFAELLFAETTDDAYALVMQEDAFEGQTLGLLLSPEIDPAFAAQSKGRYFQVAARLPVARPNSVGGSISTCHFSGAGTLNVADCGGGVLAPGATITDGLTTASIDDASLEIETEHRVTRTSDGTNDELVWTAKFTGNAHPWPASYVSNWAFDVRDCTAL